MCVPLCALSLLSVASSRSMQAVGCQALPALWGECTHCAGRHLSRLSSSIDRYLGCFHLSYNEQCCECGCVNIHSRPSIFTSFGQMPVRLKDDMVVLYLFKGLPHCSPQQPPMPPCVPLLREGPLSPPSPTPIYVTLTMTILMGVKRLKSLF